MEGGTKIGSHAFSLNYEAVHYRENVYRKMAVIPLDELVTSADPVGLFKKVFKDYAMAVLIVIPDTTDDT